MTKSACFILTVFAAALAAGSAHAGMLDKVRLWITGEALAYILSGIIVLLAGGFGFLFVRVTRTFKEAGEFLLSLGNALEDKRITREELALIIREGRDVFRVWR